MEVKVSELQLVVAHVKSTFAAMWPLTQNEFDTPVNTWVFNHADTRAPLFIQHFIHGRQFDEIYILSNPKL